MTKKGFGDKPYNIRVHVRNNLLMSAITDMGFESQAAFARYAGINVSRLNAMIGLREAPISENGEFTPLAKELMEVLGACPSDLWTEEQLTMSLDRNTASTSVDLEEIHCLLRTGKLPVHIEFTHEIVESKLFAERVRELIFDGTLTERESAVLRMRFGIGIDRDRSLDEVARVLDVSRERVRQIEARAFRKIRKRELVAPKLIRLVSPDGMTERERSERSRQFATEEAKRPSLGNET